MFTWCFEVVTALQGSQAFPRARGPPGLQQARAAFLCGSRAWGGLSGVASGRDTHCPIASATFPRQEGRATAWGVCQAQAGLGFLRGWVLSQQSFQGDTAIAAKEQVS